MRSTSTILATARLALAAACGGKSSAATTPGNAGGTDGFDEAKVKAALAALAVPSACDNGSGAPTLGAHLEMQRESLGGASATDESFACQPPLDGQRECTWSVFGKPPAEPAADDPCGGECCSGYQIIVKVDDAGTVDPNNVFCNAPG